MAKLHKKCKLPEILIRNLDKIVKLRVIFGITAPKKIKIVQNCYTYHKFWIVWGSQCLPTPRPSQIRDTCRNYYVTGNV